MCRRFRNDIYGYAWSGSILSQNATIDDANGIAYGQNVRAKGHYWYDDANSAGLATLSVYKIDAGGSTGDLIMHTGTSTVISDGNDFMYDLFGIGNRTDTTSSYNNVVKIDNLYLSFSSANQNPVDPNFDD